MCGPLADVHRLEEPRVVEPDVGGHLGQGRLPREGGEGRVEVVQRVADLVDRLLDGLAELAVGPERLLLEEVPDLPAAAEEVVVADALLLVRREDAADLCQIGAAHQLDGALDQRRAVLLGGEALDDEEAVAVVGGELLGAQHGVKVRGSRAGPQIPKVLGFHSISPSTAISGRRRARTGSASCSSARASHAPRQ